jgi:hypothetical protein
VENRLEGIRRDECSISSVRGFNMPSSRPVVYAPVLQYANDVRRGSGGEPKTMCGFSVSSTEDTAASHSGVPWQKPTQNAWSYKELPCQLILT